MKGWRARRSRQDGAARTRAQLRSRCASPKVAWFGLLWFGLTAACQKTPAGASTTRHQVLGKDRVAIVGTEAMSSALVARVAEASRLEANEAVDRLIELQLLGAWARSGGLSHSRYSTVERALLARRILERIDGQARTPEQPTDDEIASLTRDHWLEMDRPPAWRVAHAVVLTQGHSESSALAVAQRIAAAVRGIGDEGSFIERARAVPSDGLKVVTESLPPVTADGRTFWLDGSGKPGGAAGTFDLEFAKAAAKLQTVGSQSGIVRTAFGFHVMLLLGRVEGYVMSLAERRQQLKAEVFKRRAEKASRQLLDQLQASRRPELERAALEWTSRVRVTE